MTPLTNENSTATATATSTKKGLIRRLQHGYGIDGSLFAVDETSSPLLGQQSQEQSTTREKSKSTTTTTNWTVTGATTIAVATARTALSYISCQQGGQGGRRLRRCCLSGATDGCSTSDGSPSASAEQQRSTSKLFCRSRSSTITVVSQTAVETVNFMLALISSLSSSSPSSTTSGDSYDAANTAAAASGGDLEEHIEERWQPTALMPSSSSLLKQEILPLTTTRSTMVNNDEVTESTSSWSSFSATPAKKTSSSLPSSTNRKKKFAAQGEQKVEQMKSSNFPVQQQADPKNNLGTPTTKPATDINTKMKEHQDLETGNSSRPIKIEPINDQGGEAEDDHTSLILKDYTCSRVELSSLPPPSDFDNITFRTSDGEVCRSNRQSNNIQYYDDDDSIERMFKQGVGEDRTNRSTTTTGTSKDINLKDGKVADAAQNDSCRVRFYIRIPIRTDESLAQVRRERLERAERTADFMDLAKTLSLRLSRDSWSGRSSSFGSFSSTHPPFRRHRSRSMDSTSDYMSHAGSSVSNCSQDHQLTQQHQQLLHTYRRASAGCGVNPISRSQKLRRSSMDALPARRSSMGAVPRRRSSLEAMPRRRSSNGFGVTPFSRPPLSRHNSSESLHRLLKQEMQKNGIPPSPLLLSPTNAETHTVSMNSIESTSQPDSSKVKEALGYEDIDETLYTQTVGGEEKVSHISLSHQRSSMSSMYSSSTSTSQYGYEDNRTTTPANGGTGAPGVDQQQQIRPNRHHRAQRRGSLVAGSKIERYDDNANKRKKQRRRSSIQMQVFQG